MCILANLWYGFPNGYCRLLARNKRPRWSVSASRQTGVAVPIWAVVMLAAILAMATRHLLRTTPPARSAATTSVACVPLATPASPCLLVPPACWVLAAAAAGGTLALAATWFVAAMIALLAAGLERPLLARRKTRKLRRRSTRSGKFWISTHRRALNPSSDSGIVLLLAWKTATTWLPPPLRTLPPLC